MFSRYRFKDGFTTIVGNPGYAKINYLGEIQTHKGEKFKTFLDDEGNPSVTLDAWNGYRDYKIIELILFQYKDIHIQEDRWNEIAPFVIDGDNENIQAKNVGYRFIKGPIPIRLNSEFFYIPGFTKYAINRDGLLINARTERPVRFFTSKGNKERNIKGGYKVTTVPSPNGKTTTLSRHRALALTFLDYPDNVDSMVVNHIDGIPGNDSVDNLEWTTRGQNNTHAYENDLKNQHKRVIVRDVRTGKDTEYYSIAEAARQLGWAVDETIRHRLYQCEFGMVFADGTQVKLKDDPREFPKVDDPEKAIQDAKDRNPLGEERPLKVRNCLSLEVTEYKSIMDASRATGVNSGTIAWRLDRDNFSPLFGYQFKHLEDGSEWPDFTMEEYRQSLVPNQLGVSAKNHFTGEEVEFESVAAAQGEFKGDLSTVLRAGRQYFRSDGWHLKYSDDKWDEVNDPEEFFYKMIREVVAKSEETGEVFVEPNAKSMGRRLGFPCSKRLRASALTRGKEVYRGYRFKLGEKTEWAV